MLDINRLAVDYNTEIAKGVFYRNDYLEKMDALIRHIYSDTTYSLQDMGFYWSRQNTDTHSSLHLDRNSRRLLSLEQTEDTIMFRWDTFGTIKICIKQIELLLNFYKLNHNSARVVLLFDEHPSIYTTYNKLASRFYNIAHNRRISGMRLFTPSVHMLYRLGDKSLIKDATISILIPLHAVNNAAVIECIARVFNNTSRAYIPSKRLNDSLAMELRREE